MIEDLQSLCTAALRSLPDVVAAAAEQAKAAAAEAEAEAKAAADAPAVAEVLEAGAQDVVVVPPVAEAEAAVAEAPKGDASAAAAEAGPEEANAAGVLEAAAPPVAAASDVPIFVQAVGTFLDFLGMKEAPCRRVEAAHTLVVIYDHLNPEQQERVRDDAIPLLLDMLHSTNEPAKAKAEAAVLEIVYGDNAVHRNFVLSGIAQGLMGDDPLVKLNRTKDMDWILSAGPTHPNPPAQHFLDAGVVPRLVDFLQRDAERDLQCEAARVLGNMAGRDDDQFNAVVDAGAIPAFVRLLSSPNNGTKEHSALGLAVITARSRHHHFLVVQNDAVPSLLELLRVRATDPVVRRAATRALAEFYRLGGVNDLDLDPPLKNILLDEVIPLLVEDIRQSNDAELQYEPTRALVFVAAHDDEYTNAVVDAEAIPAFVPLLSSHNENVKRVAALGVGFFARSSLYHWDVVLQNEALPPLLELVRHGETDLAVLPHAIRALANLFCWRSPPDLVPPIQQLLRDEVVPQLVSFLPREDDFNLQNEAARALKHIARGDAELTNAAVDAGAISFAFPLLRSDDKKVAKEAALLLGNFAKDNLNYRNEILHVGAMPALIFLTLASEGDSDLDLLRSATYAMSMLCCWTPRPSYASIEPALLAIRRLINHRDKEILANVCWTLSYLAGGTDGLIQEVIDTEVCPQLVELLRHRSLTVQKPAIQAVRHILKGSKLQSQVILALNPLSSIRDLLGSADPDIRELSCQCISTLVLGDQERVQMIIDYRILPSLIQLVGDIVYEVQKEAAVAIRNFTEHGSLEQIDTLVKAGCIPPMCGVLTVDASKSEIVSTSLKGLENILHTGWEISQRDSRAGNVSGPRCNQMVKYMASYRVKGRSKLVGLIRHPDEAIREKARSLLGCYFGVFDEDELCADAVEGIESPRQRRRLG